MNIRTALSSRPRNFLVASLAAAALALTACQGGGEPVVQPTPAETSSATAAPSTSTPSPTATATYKPADASGKAQNVPVPVKPALADENSKEGLEAFTKYWFELLSYGYETGDVTELAALSNAETCKLCAGLQTIIGKSWADGMWISGGQVSTPSIEGIFDASGTDQRVTLQVIQETLSIHMPDGSLYQEPTPQQNNASHVVASFDDVGWKIDDLGLIR